MHLEVTTSSLAEAAEERLDGISYHPEQNQEVMTSYESKFDFRSSGQSWALLTRGWSIGSWRLPPRIAAEAYIPIHVGRDMDKTPSLSVFYHLDRDGAFAFVFVFDVLLQDLAYEGRLCLFVDIWNAD